MTMKKFIALTSAAVAAVAVTASAQVSVDFVSAYVFRGAELGEESVQPGFDTTILGGAVSVGTWANFDIDSSEFNEIDYFFGYALPTGDSPVTAEIGYCEYVYNVGGEADREPYLSLGFGDASLMVAYGIDGAIDKLLYLELGYGTSFAVSENLSIDVSAALGYVDPDEGESGFSHLTLSAGTGIAIPETDYSVSVGVTYIVETDEDVQEIGEDFYFTVGTVL
jgi:uncharacterized protein (TIGR02001 family)